MPGAGVFASGAQHHEVSTFRWSMDPTNMGKTWEEHGCQPKNRGTPKWMVNIMLPNPMNKWMIWGYRYFWKYGCQPKNMGFSTQIIPFVHRVWKHYIHHPFWGTIIFGNIHI